MNRDIKKLNLAFLFFSNSLENLSDCLKANLFLGEDLNLFSENYLIVPSPEMEKWAMLRLAEKLGVFGCVKSLFLNEAISFFSQKLFIKQPFYFPSEWELTLKLEELIVKGCASNNPLFLPLKEYLKGAKKRVITLAKALSCLFQKYGIYGGKKCKSWEENPKDWQELLWQQLFLEWDYPLKILPSLELKEGLKPCSLHLFSFSHLSRLHFKFFEKISERHKVYFYQLSPCLEFWSDTPSCKNSLLIEEEFLEHAHPLLASLGKVSREMARLTEETEALNVFEAYKEENKITALSVLQKNLLFLENQILPDDDTIQIHASTSPLREVENLFQFITHQVVEKQLEPKDFLVLAPDISEYEPYIRGIFDDPQIADLKAHTQNRLVEGLFYLLDLDKTRWSAHSLMKLFDHPLFRKKRGWSKEETLQIRKWIQKSGIRWGLSGAHRDQLLKDEYGRRGMQEEGATWKKGIGFLLENLAVSNGEQFIDFTESELLGKCAKILDELFEVQQLLKEEKTLAEWNKTLLALIDKFFASSDDESFLVGKLNQLLTARIPSRKFSFETIYFLLEEWVGKVPFTLNSNILSSVFFCSIVPMRAIPAKVICLIGMNEGKFPRKEGFSSLDLLKKQPGGDYAPTLADFDRAVLLEAILSARDLLFISYLDAEATQSPAVSEIERLLQTRKVIKHPAKSYDTAYFNGLNQDLKSASQIDYQLALRFKNARRAPSFFEREAKEGLRKNSYLIDVSELNRLVRAPLGLYFETQFGCRFPNEERIMDEEAFALSALQKSFLYKKSFKEKPEQLLEQAEEGKDFPLGLFGQTALQDLKEKLEIFHTAVSQFGSYSIELSEHVEKGFFESPSLWQAPPVQIELKDGVRVTLIGKIDCVFNEGLLSVNHLNFQNAAKLWPSFLILRSAELPSGFHVNSLFFPYENEKKNPIVEAHHLPALLEYYLKACHNPSPLFPEWLECFLKGQKELLLKKGCASNSIQDPLLKWALIGRSPPDFDKLLYNWGYWAETIFRGLYDAGF